jgi:hypothetical protein
LSRPPPLAHPVPRERPPLPGQGTRQYPLRTSSHS